MTVEEQVALVREKGTAWVGDMGGAFVAHPCWDMGTAMRCVPVTIGAFRSFRLNAVESLIDWLHKGNGLPDPFDKDGFYHWIVHCVCRFVNETCKLEGDERLHCSHITMILKSVEDIPHDQIVGQMQVNVKCPGHASFSDN